MGTSSSAGAGYGYMGKLEEEWNRQHGIFYHARAPPFPHRNSPESRHVFRGKRCLDFGICVCSGQGKAALTFWQKLSTTLRKVFKKKTPERAELDSGHIVLQCDSSDSSGSRLFYHMGYCNLKTYHFTVLAMRPRGEPKTIGKHHVQPLCLSDGGFEVVQLALHCFSKLDLDAAWSVRIRHLFLGEQRIWDLSLMRPHHVDILVEPDSNPIWVWRGWEAERQKIRAKRSGQTRAASKGGPAVSKPLQHRARPQEQAKAAKDIGPVADAPAPAESLYFELGSDCDYEPSIPDGPFEGDLDPDSDLDLGYHSDGLSGNESGKEEDDETSSDSSEDGGGDLPFLKAAGQWLDLAEVEALFQEDEDLDLEPEPTAPATVPDPEANAVCEASPRDLLPEFVGAPAESNLDTLNLGGLGDHEDQNADSSDAESAESKTSDISISSRGPSEMLAELGMSVEDLGIEDDVVEGSSPPAAASSSCPKTSKVADDRFEVPPNGSIRYNFKGKNLVAHCACHAGNCRRTRTINRPVNATRNKAQGRPIGLLTAWLEQAHSFAGEKEHSSRCRPSFEERKAARQRFYEIEGGVAWAKKFERELEDGEAEEPRDMN